MVVAEPAAGAGFAKLADFGVAHVASGDPLTRTGDIVGTLAYMAPEQAEGARVTRGLRTSTRSRLTLFEAWTGSNPVKAAGPGGHRAQSRAAAAFARRCWRDLPLELCDAIDAALELDSSLRPSPAVLRRELRRAEQQLDDEGGLVEPETLARVGLTTVRRHPLLDRDGTAETRVRPPEVAPVPSRFDPVAVEVPARSGRFARRREPPLADEPLAAPAATPLVQRLLARVGAGLVAGGLVLAALTQLGPTPPFDPLAAAGVAALAVALLTRLGWIAAVLGVCGWLASPDANREGTALVLAVAAAPVPLLLPRAGALWSLPVLAPLLGAIALGPAFVAVAGQVTGLWRRAALGAAGMVWLAIAEVLGGEELLFGPADGTLPRSDWQGSLDAAATDALGPLLTSGVLATALVWAAFAVLLPLVVRGRQLVLDALGAALWATGLIVAQAAIGDLLAGTTALDQARGAVAGPILAALGAVALAAVRPTRAETTPAPSDYPAMPR